jgi:hypothetical protein
LLILLILTIDNIISLSVIFSTLSANETTSVCNEKLLINYTNSLYLVMVLNSIHFRNNFYSSKFPHRAMYTLLSLSYTVYLNLIKLDISRTYFHLHNIHSEKWLKEGYLFFKLKITDQNFLMAYKLFSDKIKQVKNNLFFLTLPMQMPLFWEEEIDSAM